MLHEKNAGQDEPGGDLVPVAMPLGAIIIAAAHRSGQPLPLPPRIAKLGRDLRGEAFRPVLAWRNPRGRSRT